MANTTELVTGLQLQIEYFHFISLPLSITKAKVENNDVFIMRNMHVYNENLALN